MAQPDPGPDRATAISPAAEGGSFTEDVPTMSDADPTFRRGEKEHAIRVHVDIIMLGSDGTLDSCIRSKLLDIKLCPGYLGAKKARSQYAKHVVLPVVAACSSVKLSSSTGDQSQM